MPDNKFCMLLMDNNRSKAYLQNFLRLGFIPEHVFVLGEAMAGIYTKQKLIHRIPKCSCFFDEKESVYKTLEQNRIPYTPIGNMDVNAPDVCRYIKEADADYVIYSGLEGVILREGILDAGKSFIHAHSGTVPHFKGSTTVYYSMLLQKTIGCSVIFLGKEIDCGDILFTRSYPIPPQPVDFDMVVDPLIRAETLLTWLNEINGDISGAATNPQNPADGNTYYIIHPVLKHLAIKRIDSDTSPTITGNIGEKPNA